MSDDAAEPMPDPLPRARSFPWFDAFLVVVLALCVGLAGLALMFWNPDPVALGTVQQVRISAKQDLDPTKVGEMLDTPDYYVVVMAEPGSLRTQTMEDTKVGSGLTFTLPVPVRLEDIREVRVVDENLMGDSLVDRIDRPARQAAGEKFRFELMGWEPPMRRDRVIGLALAIAGGLILLLAVVRFIWSQAL